MWSCPKCHFESSTSTDWLDHLRERHQKQFSDSLASAATAAACRKIFKPVQEEKCLLCDKYPSSTRRALVAHIGKHMEEVAMMALPKDHVDDSGHSSESDDGNNDIDYQSKDATGPSICKYSGCTCTFDNEQDLRAHIDAIRKMDGTRDIYECPDCSQYSSYGYFGSGGESHDCEICGAPFYRSGGLTDLKRHMMDIHGRSEIG